MPRQKIVLDVVVVCVDDKVDQHVSSPEAKNVDIPLSQVLGVVVVVCGWMTR